MEQSTRDFLSKIVAHKKLLLKRKHSLYEVYRANTAKTQLSHYGLFKSNISRPGKINLIAEIKKASPSKGLICRDFDCLRLAKIYAECKVAAISVLTEDKYFLGKPGYIRTVSSHLPIPVLAKDFIIDEGQIYEAFLCGASAVLLIVAILDDEQLKKFLKFATDLDMGCLVEVHNESELTRALNAGAEMIGINNRDLHTFTVDLKTAERLIPLIPKGKVIVAESGIQSADDVRRLKEAGANAVLIGETFLRADDVGAKVREIMGENL